MAWGSGIDEAAACAKRGGSPELGKGEKERFSGAGGFLADGHILFPRMVGKKAAVTGGGLIFLAGKGTPGGGSRIAFSRCSGCDEGRFPVLPPGYSSLLLLPVPHSAAFFLPFRGREWEKRRHFLK